MHSYHLKAVKNYKDAFQLMHATEMECFNNCSYFYCVNNEINFSTIVVNPNKMPPIVAKGQSHVELLKELWDRTE